MHTPTKIPQIYVVGFSGPRNAIWGVGCLYRACCSIGTFQVTGIISGTSTCPSVPLIRVLTECVIRVLWSPKQREIFKLQFCWVRAVTWYKQCKNTGQHLFVRWQPVWIYMRQEMMEFWDAEPYVNNLHLAPDRCWTICKQSAPRSRQITTPIPHHFGMMEKYICGR